MVDMRWRREGYHQFDICPREQKKHALVQGRHMTSNDAISDYGYCLQSICCWDGNGPSGYMGFIRDDIWNEAPVTMPQYSYQDCFHGATATECIDLVGKKASCESESFIVVEQGILENFTNTQAPLHATHQCDNAWLSPDLLNAEISRKTLIAPLPGSHQSGYDHH